MSGFRETFTKDGREKMLGYDDSAAYYFGGCVLFCVLAVWSHYFLFHFMFPPKAEFVDMLEKPRVKLCRCSLCIRQHNEKKKELISWHKKIVNWKFLFQLLALIVLWYFFAKMALSLSRTVHVQVFDPFEILEISRSATGAEIRKSYLRLSRTHHPDRNPNDPRASARFILITRAYTALTDEARRDGRPYFFDASRLEWVLMGYLMVAKANYAKYGNPDGPTAMKIGIGLPKFLISTHYQILVLFFFFIVLLIVVPGFFIAYYQKQKRYLPNGLHIESAQLFAYCIKEGTRTKALPELLAASAESRELTCVRPSDSEDMKGVLSSVSIPTKKQLCTTPVILRNYALILARLQRKDDLLSDTLREDLNVILKTSDVMTQCMAEIAYYRGWLFTLQSVIEVRRRLVQGVDLSGLSAPFLQIPHFNEAAIRKCIRWRKTLKDLSGFLTEQNTNADKNALSFTQDQLNDILSFLASIPILSVTLTAYVVDETSIVEDDVVTLEIDLVRQNLEEGEMCGMVHAASFPDVRYESWWLVVYEKSSTRLAAFKRTKNRERAWKETVQFQAPAKGKWVYQCLVMSDDYVGLDVQTNICINVLGAAEVKRRLYLHPEDEALDSSPTILQQFLGGAVQPTNSSDDDRNASDNPDVSLSNDSHDDRSSTQEDSD